MKQEKNSTSEFFKEYSTMIQTIKISADISRQEIFELGRKVPYYLYVNFPINATAFEHPYFYGIKIIRGL